MAPVSDRAAGSEAVTEPRDLDELRRALAPAIAAAAAFDGWTAQAVAEAAAVTGTDPDVAAYAFGDDPMAMIAAWIAHIDAQMAAALPAGELAGLKVRERIRQLVQFRLDALAGREEAMRRALAVMAMPRNVAQALRLGWHSADAMWRLAGDTATDLNHYSKRAILAGLYAATLAVFVDDDSEGKAETRAFLGRRLDGIIRFEKAKARLLPGPDERFSMARFLGRLRYPAR
jgi:ubiquinone biosynthesis protein COQ9